MIISVVAAQTAAAMRQITSPISCVVPLPRPANTRMRPPNADSRPATFGHDMRSPGTTKCAPIATMKGMV